MCGHRHFREGGPATGEFGGGFRMRHGGPFGGPFGPGRGGPFAQFGPGGPGRGGRRRRGDVRTALLMLLHLDGPANGYQLMQALEERSEGNWRPSPGSVYPALSQLEDEGLIRQITSDAGRAYEITDTGREQVESRGDAKAPWEPEEEGHETYSAFRRTVFSTAKAAWQVVQDGDEQQVAKATELLNEARRGLYRLLAGDEEA